MVTMSNDYEWFMKCVVCGMPKERGNKELKFFKFPREIDRCRSWLKAIGKKELIYIYMEDLSELLVCAEHFHMACINEKGGRLHRIGIPSITPFPSLSDKVLAGYPKHRPKPLLPVPVTHVFTVSEPTNSLNSEGEDATNQSDTNSAINYDLPLMRSLETLIDNKYHRITKPAGIMNSISVPLMTYSSSMEKGTVFAVEDPESAFELPFLPVIEQADNNMNRPKNTKGMLSKTQRSKNYTRSSVNVGGEQSKSMKQYTNTKKLDTVLKKSGLTLVQNIDLTENIDATSIIDTVRINKIKKIIGSTSPKTSDNTTLIGEYGCETENPSTNNDFFTHNIKYEFKDEMPEDDSKAVLTLDNSADTSTSDITFVPYSQYAATVTPESKNAHTAEGLTSDYGLPLMNCIGTIFQDNMESTIKTNKPHDLLGIDVPLMQCLKTLENSNVN